MQQVSKEEFLALFDPDVHAGILALVEEFKATHIVCYENQTFDGSEFGKRTALAVGPMNTRKTLADADHHIFDLPSQRQYPTVYWEVGDGS